jgi:glycosyltransferase involved in cell wall biosynthesis
MSLTVSAVIAVRNGAAYLADALASIGASRRRPMEIVVIDGASSDASAQIAARHPLVTVWPQQGRGAADAYNEGVRRSRGDLIAFLSHDDLWSEDKLDIQAAAFEADPGLMVSFAMVRHVLLGPPPPGFRLDLLDRPVPGYIMETLVARRAVFDRVGSFDVDLATAEDIDWISRARDLKIPMALAQQVLLTKRIHGSNSSLVKPTGTQDLLEALRRTVNRRTSTPSA